MPDHRSYLPLTVAIVITVIGATVFTGWVYLYSCPIFQSAQCEDLTNWQALVLQGIVIGGGLGSYVYYLQRKTNLKIDEVISAIDNRDIHKKDYWTSSAYDNLFMIISTHKALVLHYNKLLREGVSKESLEEVAYYLKEAKFATEKAYLPGLERALSNIAHLLTDRSLYEHLTKLQLTEIRSSFDMPIITDGKDSYISELEPAITKLVREKVPVIQGLIGTLEQYLEQLKAETPTTKDL